MSCDPARADRVSRVFCNVIEEVITPRALRATSGDSLSRAQFEGLQYIYLHPDCCIKDLAHGLSVSHPAAVKLVERLTAKGLITRMAHERDRRMVMLVVTETGSAQALQAMNTRSQAIHRIIASSDETCRCNLLDCLDAFIRVALEDEKDVEGVCLRCGGRHADDCPVCQAEMALTGRPRTDK